MADDTQTNLTPDDAFKREALKNDIANILADVKLPETESEKLSKAMSDPAATTGDIAADVGLARPTPTSTPTKPAPKADSSPKPAVDSIFVDGLAQNPAENILSPKSIATTPIGETPPLTNPSPVPKSGIVFADTPISAIAKSIEPPIPAQTPVKVEAPLVVDTKDMAAVVASTKLPEKRDVRTSGDKPIAPPVTNVMPTAPGTEKPSPEETPVPEPKPAPKEQSIVTPLRTLKADMSTIVEGSKISIIRAAALEEEKKAKAAKAAPPPAEVLRARARTRHIAGMLFGIFMLFGIGGAALFGVYTLTQLQQGIQTQAPGENAGILFAEHTVSLALNDQTPDQLKQIIAQARTTPGGVIGSITRIVPVFLMQNADGTQSQRPATFGEFLKALGAKAPDELSRALSSEFFFGIHTIDQNAPIFIIPVVSYGRAFESMLAWEPSMNADFVPAFTPVPTMTRDENGLPVPRVFQDAILNNYDIRKLTDDNANIVLYYSFPNTNLLVIAESPYSFVEIISRLQAGRRL